MKKAKAWAGEAGGRGRRRLLPCVSTAPTSLRGRKRTPAPTLPGVLSSPSSSHRGSLPAPGGRLEAKSLLSLGSLPPRHPRGFSRLSAEKASSRGGQSSLKQGGRSSLGCWPFQLQGCSVGSPGTARGPWCPPTGPSPGLPGPPQPSLPEAAARKRLALNPRTRRLCAAGSKGMGSQGSAW